MIYPIVLALISAMLFGASAPASKVLLHDFTPMQMAGLLYIGAALGVLPILLKQKSFSKSARLVNVRNWRLVAALISGGILAPTLLMMALASGNAVSVSMLLSLEAPFTAALAFLFFKEHIGKLGWFAILGTTAAGALLSFHSDLNGLFSTIAAAAACLCWALDNNLTAVIDTLTPAEITFYKGLVAGSFNLIVSLFFHPLIAAPVTFCYAIICGALCYGVSLTLYILSAQKMGASRSQILFASAPFWGAAFACIFLHDQFTPIQIGAALILLGSLSLLSKDQHGHVHTHERTAHSHEHSHDDGHHNHGHDASQELDLTSSANLSKHTHWHEHSAMQHAHPHWPDLHHRHRHTH